MEIYVHYTWLTVSFQSSNSNYGNSTVGVGQAGNTFAQRIVFSPACLTLFMVRLLGLGEMARNEYHKFAPRSTAPSRPLYVK